MAQKNQQDSQDASGKGPQQDQPTEKTDFAHWRPGGEPEKAKDVGAPGDFGVPVAGRSARDLQYVSENTKRSDPGAAPAPSNESADGTRTSGAGGNNSGDGSSSAGDLDPDILGVGTGGSGVATSGNIHEKPGPDDTDGSSDQFASGGHARGEHQTHAHQMGGPIRVKGSTTTSGDDMQTNPPGEGADAATNPARGDDSFAGEVSRGEARGEDAPIRPAPDT